MRLTQIVILIVLAISIGAILYLSSDFTTYGNFQTAKSASRTLSVVGYLVKEKPVEYDPVKDPNFMGFYMTDDEGNEQYVYYKGAKPQDFERSEQVVVKGKMEGNRFHATEILLKCPSKYVNDEIILKEQS